MRERKPIRLRNYDYSHSGYYFVTVCTQHRKEWFGKVRNGQMELNIFGEIAEDLWTEIPGHFGYVRVDEFAVMPNHVHGVLIIERDLVGNAYMRSHQGNASMHSLHDKTKMLLSKVVQQYKASVTRRINSSGTDDRFVWQKSFYDHIVRSEKSLGLIREYIQNNLLKWDSDRENPLSENFDLDHDRYWKAIYDRV
ncbi:MAG TPA: transposase [Thermodesulfobacteriota bacterium]|nr:transposase [Thermodesulfobacteriota bacterium]